MKRTSLAISALATVLSISCFITARSVRAQTASSTSGVITTCRDCGVWSTGSGTVPSSNGAILWGGGGNSSSFVTTPTRKVGPELPVPTIQEIRLHTKAVAELPLASAAYLKLAMKIGLRSAATDELEILGVIHDVDLRVYNLSKVDQYLQDKASRAAPNTYWVWKALRKGDLDHIMATGTRFRDGLGIVYPSAYSHAVPQRVLEHVAAILEKLPEATFLISDYETIKPDPFMAITTPTLLGEGKIWIVDQWDEPGFNEEEAIVPNIFEAPVVRHLL